MFWGLNAKTTLLGTELRIWRFNFREEEKSKDWLAAELSLHLNTFILRLYEAVIIYFSLIKRYLEIMCWREMLYGRIETAQPDRDSVCVSNFCQVWFFPDWTQTNTWFTFLGVFLVIFWCFSILFGVRFFIQDYYQCTKKTQISGMIPWCAFDTTLKRLACYGKEQALATSEEIWSGLILKGYWHIDSTTPLAFYTRWCPLLITRIQSKIPIWMYLSKLSQEYFLPKKRY